MQARWLFVVAALLAVEAVPGQAGGIYHKDDRIQFSYSSGPNRYVFLVSLDERGTVSNFNHQGKATSVPIKPGSNRVLEGSIILDDSVGPERIFAVFSNQPLRFDELKDAADRAYRDLAKQAQVKGFRRGKVPRKVLEQMYGPSVAEELERTLVQETLAEELTRRRPYSCTRGWPKRSRSTTEIRRTSMFLGMYSEQHIHCPMIQIRGLYLYVNLNP